MLSALCRPVVVGLPAWLADKNMANWFYEPCAWTDMAPGSRNKWTPTSLAGVDCVLCCEELR